MSHHRPCMVVFRFVTPNIQWEIQTKTFFVDVVIGQPHGYTMQHNDELRAVADATNQLKKLHPDATIQTVYFLESDPRLTEYAIKSFK